MWEAAPIDPVDTWPDPRQIVRAFALRGMDVDLEPVSRAWSHRVFKLSTGVDVVAVKELRNPWNDPRWEERLTASLDYERRAIAAGVSAPEPILGRDASFLAWVPRRDGRGVVAVRVHRWADGEPCSSSPVTPAVAGWAGRTLATLHGLGLQPADRSLFPTANTENADRWDDLVVEALRRRTDLGEALRRVSGAVDRARDLARHAPTGVTTEVLTHGDIAQKNIVLTDEGPVLCDWDVVAPWVPSQELVTVALSMAGVHNVDVARRVVRSYGEATGHRLDLDSTDLARALMLAVDWIALNVERSLGLRPATAAEQALSTRLIPRLLEKYTQAVHMAEVIPELLND